MGSQIRLLAFGFIFEVKLEVEEGAFPAKSRHYYPPPPTTGTREALMERRAAPYPYSKMCELCELCELFVKKSHRFRDGIFLFLLSRIYSKAPEWRAFFVC